MSVLVMLLLYAPGQAVKGKAKAIYIRSWLFCCTLT